MCTESWGAEKAVQFFGDYAAYHGQRAIGCRSCYRIGKVEIRDDGEAAMLIFRTAS